VRREISQPVMDAIKMYIPYRQALIDAYGDHSDGKLLIRRFKKRGFPMDRTIIEDYVVRLKRKSGVDFSCHSLRRLFATTLYGITDLETLRQLMRHASIDTTFKCYIYADPQKRHEALKQAGNELFGKQPAQKGCGQ